ncbi:hypothetical protein FE810_15620 [Thalassotalea litorea]|uniref:DUF3015 domain-containing protein n=1 Tax=Thalassotalea litorea TaxID=2020715 RepID=A0A5R9IM66_9GAMM|nr:hypothetical protein [Thalassotalea litorea]TLU61099.1 hypothetical protein FE810_15620 [Thalassotalea litorea]
MKYLSIVTLAVILFSFPSRAESCLSSSDCFRAEVLKISFLRLSISGYADPHYGGDGLIMILANLNTDYAISKLVELTNYYAGDLPDDTLSYSVTAITNRKKLVGSLEAELLKPPYCEPEFQKLCRGADDKIVLIKYLLKGLAKNTHNKSLKQDK